MPRWAATTLSCRPILWSLGLEPGPIPGLAEAAGIPLGPTGAIAVDDRQRTGIDGVWAGGDCGEAKHRVSGRPVNIHLGTVANKQGRVAGINIGGGDMRFPGVLGTAITRVNDFEIARTGLTERQAADAGLDATSATAEGTTTAGYWPDAAEMSIKVVVERGSAVCSAPRSSWPRRREAGGRLCHRLVERHGGGRPRLDRSGLCPAVLRGVGPHPHRGEPGAAAG